MRAQLKRTNTQNHLDINNQEDPKNKISGARKMMKKTMTQKKGIGLTESKGSQLGLDIVEESKSSSRHLSAQSKNSSKRNHNPNTNILLNFDKDGSSGSKEKKTIIYKKGEDGVL